LIGAFLYLRVFSVKNRVISRLRRLREPKYLAGGIVGLLYFYFAFLRGAIAHGVRPPAGFAGGEMGPEVRLMVEVGGALLMLALMVMYWVFPSRRAALEFSEAEVQFLFPAPVSRRGLIHYKLLSWQMGLLFTSLVLCLFSGRLWRGHGAWMSVVGWWVGLFFFQLHGLAVSFARSWLFERGLGEWRRRLIVGMSVAVVLGGTMWWAWRTLPSLPPLEEWDVEALRSWLVALSGAPPLAWLLAPLRCVVRLAVTRDAGEFLTALPVVLGLVGIHYFWVLRANVAFEEASVQDARATLERHAAAGQGAVPPSLRSLNRRRSVLFDLPPEGRAWVAIGWKNLIAAGAAFRGRSLIPLLAMMFPMVFLGAALAGDAPWRGVVAVVAGVIAGASVILGPGAARFDLRMDLVHASDWLRSLPLTGREVVLGELLAPWAVLGTVQVLASTVCGAFLPSDWVGDGLDGVLRRLAVVVAASLMGPALSLLGLGLQNLAVLLFPAWVLPVPGQPRGGFEVMGQQIIVFAGQTVAFLLALIPAALLGGGVFAAVSWAAGPWTAVVPGALVAAAALFAEVALLIDILGRLWDRLD
jgi:hypothetical protein